MGLELGPLSPMPPVDAALRAVGGRGVVLIERVSGARAIAWAVVSCRASIALTGDAVLEGLDLDVKEERSRSARLFDDDRTPKPRPEVGGGGKFGVVRAIGESVKNEGGVGVGEKAV